MSGLPDLPSEDAMIRLKSASEAAHAQSRQYVGSAGGEDLQVNFGPSWTRTPRLDVLVGNGTLKTKSVMLLTCSGANRIESTISVMPISKIMTSLGRQDGHHEGHGPSPFDRVPVGLDPCGVQVRRFSGRQPSGLFPYSSLLGSTVATCSCHLTEAWGLFTEFLREGGTRTLRSVRAWLLVHGRHLFRVRL